jgi:LEA14-like dessication related protein
MMMMMLVMSGLSGGKEAVKERNIKSVNLKSVNLKSVNLSVNLKRRNPKSVKLSVKEDKFIMYNMIS